MRSETLTAVLAAPHQQVFEYMSNIEKLPEWATEFARELERDGEDYKVVNGCASSTSRSRPTPRPM